MIALSAAIAALAALLLLVVVPRGGDAAAHLYRTMLVHRGALLWDNLWFAGQYPLVSYSLIYYLAAAVVGNAPLAAAGVVLSALLFSSIMLRRYGSVARWPSYCFAAVAGGQFFTGDYPYTVAFAALLATVWALQRNRTWLAVVCAALTLGCSPLAFLFLCLVLFALWIDSAQPPVRVLVVGVSLVALAGVELGAQALFPSPGLYYPFASWRLALGLPVGLLGAALAFRSRATKPFATIFVLWSVAASAAYLVASPVGRNVLRPGALVFPLMLLVALLVEFRPRWLAFPAVAAAFAANVGPYLTTAIARSDPAAKPSFWAPMLRYVVTHSSASYRLEVVPTINHWEAYYVPKAGFAIARGWYQQLDLGDYPRLQQSPLAPRVYRTWLRSVGVRYVVLGHDAPGTAGLGEARLLASGRSGLTRVFQSPSGSVYRLPHASPILTGPAPAAITRLTSTRIQGRTARRGTYLLRVHFTPLWTVERGAVFLSRGPSDMTRLHVQRPGAFSLRAPGVAGALDSILDGGRSGSSSRG